MRYDAVVLAGGRGSRLGGLSKPDLSIGGRRLIDIAVTAVGRAERIVVVGDVEVPPGVLKTREKPAYGGPVAGLAAGLALLAAPAPWIVVLASDLPDAEAAVEVLLRNDPPEDCDGVCLLDADGRLQWLLGVYRAKVLVRRVADRGDITALYRLLEPLKLVGIDPQGANVGDVDTPEDAARYGAQFEERP